MAPSADPASVSNSGIRKLSNGESIIPASMRADGSVRKQIRVKPGYKPPEDVELYKNRTAEAWKNRGKGGVPGADGLNDAIDQPQSAAAAKNAKRREARKKAAEAAKDAANDEDGQDPKSGTVVESVGGGSDQNETLDPEVEAAKEARKLAKKLRQARELKDKKDNGGDLLPEQFAKVIKMNELIRQLDALGFTADGERKSEGQENTESISIG